MPVTWKKSPRFKPAVLLDRIASVRTVNPEGGASFSGFELEDCLPALHSMLNFPDAASEVDSASLVWRGLAKVRKDLTPATFLLAVNTELSEKLATKEQAYYLLTSLSIDHRDFPATLTVLGAEIRISPSKYPTRIVGVRAELLRANKVPVAAEPDNYCRVVVRVKAKAEKVAVNRALRAVDLQRALWCLMGNSRMQLAFGGAGMEPINVVRLGSRHTIHHQDGEAVQNGVWFEPNFTPARLFRPDKPDVVQSNSRWALRQIQASKYGERLTTSLLRFVRAFDEPEANTAFLRLWGALEALTTPGQADYDSLVRRCSFLFKEVDFHRQLLEHLREYRNASVHAGEESDRARTHCYQLQLYFVSLIWFHVRNAKVFTTLEEANEFLDLPANRAALENRLRLTKKALDFIG
jgi:hypothetical protein